jgi:hypothetical protein
MKTEDESMNNDLTRGTHAPFWTVAIYLCDRMFGGPEEGGWYYDAGHRVDHPLDGVNPNSLLTVFTGEGTVYKDTEEQTAGEQEAHAYAALLQTQLDATVNFGLCNTNSILSSGRYYARAYPGHPPAHFPQERPYYE